MHAVEPNELVSTVGPLGDRTSPLRNKATKGTTPSSELGTGFEGTAKAFGVHVESTLNVKRYEQWAGVRRPIRERVSHTNSAPCASDNLSSAELTTAGL